MSKSPVTLSTEAASNCDAEPGRVVPVVDRNRCEGKKDCVAVCPYSVFEVRTLLPEDKKALSLRGRLKGWAHGWQQAYIVAPDACHACGLCVAACPEKALRLSKRAEVN
ncbi:MAG: ferredoxin family protein [Gammaproteobacteria bacterium]|nr:ferredoxin family protein [Gammaproteobacteria bacterium]